MPSAHFRMLIHKAEFATLRSELQLLEKVLSLSPLEVSCSRGAKRLLEAGSYMIDTSPDMSYSAVRIRRKAEMFNVKR